MVELSITSLKITYEDEWLKKYVELFGDSVEMSPQHQYLIGNKEPLKYWMLYRNIDWVTRANIMDELVGDIVLNGQKEPIKVYKDFRINTGHKRSAVLLYQGKITIKAEYVPDDYKL